MSFTAYEVFQYTYVDEHNMKAIRLYMSFKGSINPQRLKAVEYNYYCDQEVTMRIAYSDETSHYTS